MDGGRKTHRISRSFSKLFLKTASGNQVRRHRRRVEGSIAEAKHYVLIQLDVSRQRIEQQVAIVLRLFHFMRIAAPSKLRTALHATVKRPVAYRIQAVAGR